ncbi:MAG: LLM class flavin-dependent oxidoreductase, partial [Myxococcota bacterium]
MPMFGLRYDLRCPPFAEATSADLVEAAIEQCAWADERGFASVTLSEHHGAEDGYLPSPLVLAAAMAARTRRIRIVLAALIAPLQDPLRLAEDIAVLDVISKGRVIPVLSGGY